MDSFGKRLEKARKDKGYTQEDLANKLEKKNNKTISNWENDLSKPHADDLLLLANLLGVSIDWLMKGEESVYIIKEPNLEYKLLAQNAELQQKVIELQEKLINNQAADLERLKNDQKSVADI